jgi:hypothetical protein
MKGRLTMKVTTSRMVTAPAKKLTIFERFRESLYDENLRAAWELESMVYRLMARVGLSEPDALELACRIVASEKPVKGAARAGLKGVTSTQAVAEIFSKQEMAV